MTETILGDIEVFRKDCWVDPKRIAAMMETDPAWLEYKRNKQEKSNEVQRTNQDKSDKKG